MLNEVKHLYRVSNQRFTTIDLLPLARCFDFAQHDVLFTSHSYGPTAFIIQIVQSKWPLSPSGPGR